MANEIQRFYWGSQSSPVAVGNVEAGTFTLTFDSEETTSLNPSDDAATIQAALEALTTIGSGNVLVELTANGFTVEFQGTLANTNVVQTFDTLTDIKQKADTITLNVIQVGESPVACVPSINTITTAAVAVNEVQQVDLGGATTGTFDLNGNATSATVATLDESGIQAACDTIWGLYETVVLDIGGGFFSVTFSGSTWDAQDIPEMTVSANTTDGSPIVTTTTEGSLPISQVDQVTFDSVAVAGQMMIDDDTCDWDQDASIAITITGATVSATTPASGSIEITWDDDQPHTPVEVTTSTLVSDVGIQHIFSIDLADLPTEGQFLLSLDDVPDENEMAYLHSAATIESIMITNGHTNYTVSGPDYGPWVLSTIVNATVGVWSAQDSIAAPLRKSISGEFVTVQEGAADNPTIVSLSPTDDATDVSPTTNLVITFSAAVDAEAGAANNIDIYKASDDSLIESIDAQDGKVTGGGTDTITIDPEATLEAGVGYYVLIGEDAFDDLDSNSFAGISDKTVWNFTIAAEGGGGAGINRTLLGAG